MNNKTATETRIAPRILVVDDNPSIHEDFRKILCPEHNARVASIASLAQDVFGDCAIVPTRGQFEMDSAYQGQEALDKVRAAEKEGRPYSLAFMDVRMPPGWDGVETIRHIWQEHPHIQVVICTAYSDYSWDQILTSLGETDSLVILKKPFDNVEVLQLAHTLTKKWLMTRAARTRMADLDDMVKKRTLELLEANHRLQNEIERRSRVESELRESEERFRKAFTSVAVPLLIVDSDTDALMEVNQSFLKFSGFESSEAIGSTLSSLSMLHAPAEYRTIVQNVSHGEPAREAALTLRRKDGVLRHTIASIEQITLGKTACLLAALHDLTDQRQLEEQLRQSQKMEAVGRLAAGIAHDFNNLLTVIHGYTGLQLAKEHLDADVAKAFRQVKAASDRAASLTRQLLAFSRQQIVQCRPCNLLETITRMKGLLTQALGETIALECDVAPNLPDVFADESGLDQIIMNLAVNASDAMPAGGKLTISAAEQAIAPRDLAQAPERREGRFIVLGVSDTGCGMDEVTMSRIFEPFFTTKPIGRGTGLGLSTVFGIVKQHGGWIEVESAPGAGSTFRVFLSVAEKEPHNVESQEHCNIKQPVRLERGDAILVVEDEQQVREFIATVLAKQGFEIIAAASGAEALSKWSSISDRVQLVITDIVMPHGISGTVLAKHLLRRKPELRVVYISGYQPDDATTDEVMREDVNFLSKPFSSECLTRLIRHALSEPDREDLAKAGAGTQDSAALH